jgi:uroporphyrin-III C-methyltransferase
LRTLLADLGDMVVRERVQSPALIVIGAVAALADADDRLHIIAARAENLA